MRVLFIPMLTILACGASPAPAPEPPSPPLRSGAPGPRDWEVLTHEQKLQYMTKVVLPKEKELFAAYDSARWGSIECRTCHGKGAADGSYKMPNPDLVPITGGKGGFEAMLAKDPKMLRFMQQKVVPETAKLLGVKAFDMESHTGFSCYQCHVKKGVLLE